MNIAIVIFPGFTALDAVGPYQVLAQLGGDVVFVAEHAGPVTDSGGLTFEAQAGLDDITDPEVIVVAGGIPAVAMAYTGHSIVDWLESASRSAQWTTSVCTGSLLLGAAGLIRGREATSHWYARDRLRDFGAIPVDRRVVEAGTIITAAGVSAGIDMSLTLAARLSNERTAQLLQLDIEYAPEPPFDAGSPHTAPDDVVADLRAMYEPLLGRGK